MEICCDGKADICMRDLLFFLFCTRQDGARWPEFLSWRRIWLWNAPCSLSSHDNIWSMVARARGCFLTSFKKKLPAAASGFTDLRSSTHSLTGCHSFFCSLSFEEETSCSQVQPLVFTKITDLSPVFVQDHRETLDDYYLIYECKIVQTTFEPGIKKSLTQLPEDWSDFLFLLMSPEAVSSMTKETLKAFLAQREVMWVEVADC